MESLSGALLPAKVRPIVGTPLTSKCCSLQSSRVVTSGRSRSRGHPPSECKRAISLEFPREFQRKGPVSVTSAKPRCSLSQEFTQNGLRMVNAIAVRHERRGVPEVDQSKNNGGKKATRCMDVCGCGRAKRSRVSQHGHEREEPSPEPVRRLFI